ncbi:glycosyltransferase family 4 protein [Limoniibacter endophyticus]|uniref:Glycosyl transferase n=1 Tax=Limoniibacter endophyticus TaxID=1565040 RepID=A0A8J3DIT0_9HYPH|nr:glycosyltransferase family 4 protein [Limoniibacter endophyticus]GHC72372.1 glycosyl transferase [Limoniibacter endophyticus]
MKTLPTSLRILMSLDAVGGVWRYAVDLAEGLVAHGIESVFVGFGPRPHETQVAEAEKIGAKLLWFDLPLDWMAEDARQLSSISAILADLVVCEKIDLLQLNLPSQAANLDLNVPIVVVSHSCVVTWFHGVRESAVPDDWSWQYDLNQRGYERADLVIAPSKSHATTTQAVYGLQRGIEVVHNATRVQPNPAIEKQNYIFSAGRWWDEGKNAALLEGAAPDLSWPLVTVGNTSGPSGQSFQFTNPRHKSHLPHSDAMRLMAGAGVVASPSIYEPFGLVALEAARQGAALLLSDIPTYRELWNDAALFFDPRDVATFVAGANRLAKDGDLRETLAAKAFERSRQFSLARQAERMAELYMQTLENSSRIAAE